VHSVCFLFWMVFFLGHCLALYVCCVLDRENSKDSFIHSFGVLWFLWGTNCYVTMIEQIRIVVHGVLLLLI